MSSPRPSLVRLKAGSQVPALRLLPLASCMWLMAGQLAAGSPRRTPHTQPAAPARAWLLPCFAPVALHASALLISKSIVAGTSSKIDPTRWRTPVRIERVPKRRGDFRTERKPVRRGHRCSSAGDVKWGNLHHWNGSGRLSSFLRDVCSNGSRKENSRKQPPVVLRCPYA